MAGRGDDAGYDFLTEASLTTSEEFSELMGGASTETDPAKKIDDIYGIAFGTPAGQAVLKDLYSRYVHVTRAVPGEGSDAAFLREGMAQVVMDIMDKSNRSKMES